jgi:hypothetical protein
MNLKSYFEMNRLTPKIAALLFLYFSWKTAVFLIWLARGRPGPLKNEFSYEYGLRNNVAVFFFLVTLILIVMFTIT